MALYPCKLADSFVSGAGPRARLALQYRDRQRIQRDGGEQGHVPVFEIQGHGKTDVGEGECPEESLAEERLRPSWPRSAGTHAGRECWNESRHGLQVAAITFTLRS